MRHSAMFLVGPVFCATALATMSTPSFAQQPAASPPMLFRADLEGIPGQEAIIQLVQIPPNGRAPKHVHPDGHEIIYVLEGETFLEMEGQPNRSAKSGQVLHVPPNIPHGGGNSSATAPLKLLVVRIKDKSKPIMVPLK